METIKIGILGHGNLGRGVECAIMHNEDMILEGIYTRRSPQTVTPVTGGAAVYPIDKLAEHKDSIDVLILCGGSATDLPEQTPRFAADFNVVDSFDNHAHIPQHFEAVDKAAAAGGRTALISAGWDPGLFSLARVYGESVLPTGSSYTFWGRGVSQGHSDAIRRIEGVLDARQYTVPIAEAVEKAAAGTGETFTPRQMHRRECYVVAAPGADRDRIRQSIVTMPDYFAPYDTTVEFITMEELKANHSGLPHGGFVIRSGRTDTENESKAAIRYSLELDSNPQFTAGVLVACARAVYRLSRKGDYGCKTILDLSPALLSPRSPRELRKHCL